MMCAKTGMQLVFSQFSKNPTEIFECNVYYNIYYKLRFLFLVLLMALSAENSSYSMHWNPCSYSYVYISVFVTSC